jgi:hypothetical protein
MFSPIQRKRDISWGLPHFHPLLPESIILIEIILYKNFGEHCIIYWRIQLICYLDRYNTIDSCYVVMEEIAAVKQYMVYSDDIMAVLMMVMEYH